MLKSIQIYFQIRQRPGPPRSILALDPHVFVEPHRPWGRVLRSHKSSAQRGRQEDLRDCGRNRHQAAKVSNDEAAQRTAFGIAQCAAKVPAASFHRVSCCKTGVNKM